MELMQVVLPGSKTYSERLLWACVWQHKSLESSPDMNLALHEGCRQNENCSQQESHQGWDKAHFAADNDNGLHSKQCSTRLQHAAQHHFSTGPCVAEDEACACVNLRARCRAAGNHASQPGSKPNEGRKCHTTPASSASSGE